MKHAEEYIAENLHQSLTRHFNQNDAPIKILMEGVGVHWNCNLELKERRSKIHCFDHRHYGDQKPEYLISFDEAEKNIAWGRTHEIDETILSSEEWINGKDLHFLYEKFEFIDGHKRIIQNIDKQLVTTQHQLNQTERDISSPWGSDIWHYDIKFKNRSCQLNGFGKNEPVSFYLQWDECTLFEVKQNNLTLMAEVIKEWLIDETNPSLLEKKYEWIEVGELAKYYENGQGVKGEFIESWKSIEKFYRKLSDEWFPFKNEALDLIQEMRNKGLDEELRAGQSLTNLLLSRARRHGLEQNAPFVQITFSGQNRMKIKSNMSGNDNQVEREVKYKGYIEKVINELLKNKIS